MAKDSRLVLERLHNELVTANAEVDALMAEGRASWVAPDMRDRYYAAHGKALRLAQQIVTHREKSGV